MVVKQCLEPLLEPHFHGDSYGYRPGKSAIEAVGVARQRCWRYPWVLDLDIKGFFDNIDHELMMKAVRNHTECRWVLMYVERWLKCPVQYTNGSVETRDKGTPQGGVVSPLLANLFLHYAFDKWMGRAFPTVPFERYADDGVPRRHALGWNIQCMPCCTKDEGWPLETAIQVEVSNHRKLRRLRAGVVSVTEKARKDSVRYVSRRRTQVNHY